MNEILAQLPIEKIIVIVFGIIGSIWGIWKVGKKVLQNGSLYTKKGAVIAKEISEALFATSDALDKVNTAIKEDGTLDENSIKEAIEAGKEVYVEFGDVIAQFKKKK